MFLSLFLSIFLNVNATNTVMPADCYAHFTRFFFDVHGVFVFHYTLHRTLQHYYPHFRTHRKIDVKLMLKLNDNTYAKIENQFFAVKAQVYQEVRVKTSQVVRG